MNWAEQMFDQAKKSAENLTLIKDYFEPAVGKELTFKELIDIGEVLREQGLTVEKVVSTGELRLTVVN